MRTTIAPAAVAALAVLATSPAVAIGGSTRYQRALYCAANAEWIASWIDQQSAARPGQADGWRYDAHRWLQAAIDTGEFGEAQAQNDWSTVISQIAQDFYAQNDRRSYLQSVANTLQDCKESLPE